MSADLHIHIKSAEVTDEVLRVFFASTLGSKYFAIGDYNPEHLRWPQAYDIVAASPNVWVGEVSWLKAALFEDGDRFVPSPVQKIHELIGENLPVLDQALYQQLLDALRLPNQTSYLVENDHAVAKFLQAHFGAQLFTVSW
jgi:hypothetical protein